MNLKLIIHAERSQTQESAYYLTQFKVLGGEKQPMVTESIRGWTGVRSGREEGGCRGIGCLVGVVTG